MDTPSRRAFLASALKGATGLFAAGGLSRLAAAQAGAAKPGRPNVLFIAVDDLNDWIGCLGGHPDVKTPNLDRLAARGVLFERAYCSAPACNPSRASLLTGILPSTSGVYQNNQPWRPAMPNAITLPQHFRANGYYVAGRGKIFHHGRGNRYFCEKSWEHYIRKGGDPVPAQRPVNGIPRTAHFDWGPLDVSDEDMDDAKVAAWASEFLGKSHDRPFLLTVGFFRPHLPWYVPKKYFDMYPPDKIALPNVNEHDLDDVPPMGRRMARPEGDHKKVLEHGQWRKAVQGYLASISFVDAQIGRVLDALERSQYAQNTITLLWGDHGWHLGEKLHWRKFALWEEATHAPLMFAAPGVTQAKGRCARTVSFLDIYPTLVDLCGLSANPALEGVSLRPLLANPKASWGRPALTTHGLGNHSVRSERWRYIRYKDGSEELYDEASDPLEWTNLAGQPEHDAAKQELAKWLPKVNAKNAPFEPRKKKRGRGKGKRPQGQAGAKATAPKKAP